MASSLNIVQPELQMLSTLRRGEMLRFAFIPNGNGKTEFGIEGCSSSADGNGLFADRLSLVLGELRANGYAFDRCGGQSLAPGKLGSDLSRSHSSTWVEVRPMAVSPALMSDCVTGFSPRGRGDVEAPMLELPDFPRSWGGCVLGCPPPLIAAIPELERFEIEFVRTDLPESAVQVLEDSLRHLKVASQKGSQVETPTLAETFLASWLWHRAGYRLTARALLRTGGFIPVPPLEMLGRDLFACECEVVRPGDPSEQESALDFRKTYPSGWPFPQLLPHHSHSDTLAVSRLHNIQLPDLPKNGLKVGVAEEADVRLPAETRDRHTYIVGATGTGKSTLLSRMIKEDLERGEGVILLDPHGDLHAEIAAAVPRSRAGDVLNIDPTREAGSPGLNILDVQEGPLRKRHTELLISELIQCFREMWDVPEAFGPMFEVYFRNAIKLLTLRNGKPLTVESFDRLFSDKEFRSKLVAECNDSPTAAFWKNVAEKTGGEASLENVTPYITSKMTPLTQGAFLTHMLAQPRDEIRLSDRINRAPIILVNLNKGVLGVQESRVLGVILMAQIMSAGLKRSLMGQRDRHPVNVYVDEFQNFVSDNVASMLSEARKFGLRLTLANQTLCQLRAKAGRQDLLETVLGNVGNMILFRLGVPDAERLKLFIDPVSQQEMQELPNFHALARLLTPEGPVRPFVMRTLPE